MSTNTSQLPVGFLDFDSIKASLRAYLQSQTQFADYNFDGSSLSVLLDILAYNTSYNAFYQSMIGAEMFLDSANLRSSVVSHAKEIGYTPRSITSAQAHVSIIITPNDGAASAVIAKNTPFLSNVDGTAYSFVTDRAYAATIGNGVFKFPDVTLIEGIPYTYQFVVDSTIPNQRFLLPSSNIDTATLAVSVQQSVSNTTINTFVLADNLLALTSDTNAYFLQEVENQQFELKFGDGIIGTALVDGNVIIANYLVSDGPAANTALSFTPSILLAGYPANNTLVNTLIAAVGGLDAETIDEIRFTAPKNYEMQKRAVTAADYALSITEQYPNADSVIVWGGEETIPPQYGKVFISIKPVLGFVITETAKTLVLQNLIRPMNLVSVIPEFVDPDYTFINVTSVVKYTPANTFKTEGDIGVAAYNAIVNFASANLDKFNLEFRYSNLLTAIDGSDSSITNDLTTIQIKKIFTPKLDTISNYTLEYYNAVLPGSMSSSSFVSADDPNLLVPYVVGYTYTLADDENGNVQMIQHGIGIPNAVARICGTVNYATGKIILQEFIPYQADVNGQITIVMTPQQNDIVPVFNNILYIKPEDISMTVMANT
jgi:hypothetical protein